MSVQLHHGDARQLEGIEPEGPYCIITDPVWPNVPEGMFDIDESPKALLKSVLLRFPNAKRVIVILRMDSDPRFLMAVPGRWPFFRTSILPYALPNYIGRKLGGLELAYWFGDNIKCVPGRRTAPGMAPKAQSGGTAKGHPCARNIDHMRWLVNWCSDPGETVIDPFMGSGTTGVAAVESARDFIGIEINQDYFALAKSLIGEAQAQQRLPVFEVPA